MLKKLVKYMVEGKFFTLFALLAHKIEKVISIIAVYFLSRSIRVEEDKILFLTFRGGYDCNAKWITQELVKRNALYKLVWVINPLATSEYEFPACVRLVERGSYEFYREISSAKIIVDNATNMAYLGYKKKKNQLLIQTWHGSLGIKRFSKNRVSDKRWVACNIREANQTDYLISNSDFEDAVYREDYWKKTPILKLGHARNDILCEGDTERNREIREKVCRFFRLEPDTKICLYAPTFRDDGDMRPYRVDYDRLMEALQTRFGGSWVIMTRFHFRTYEKLRNYRFPQGVINASEYPDIQELLACVRVGITDYSSWICDYVLTRRPGFLFATDQADYGASNRGFYDPLESLPFPLATDNEMLIEKVLHFDEEQYAAACEAFLKEKGCMDDGHASQRIADKLAELMEK